MLSLFIFGILLFYLFNILCFKTNFLVNEVKLSNHKKFIKNSNNLTIFAGLFMVIANILISNVFFSFNELLILSAIFLIGLTSDKMKNFKPIFRVMLQIIVVLLLLYYSNIMILDVRIEMLNNLLNNILITLIFTTFCVIVLINGSNFIDGVNISSIGYYLGIYCCIYFLSKKHDLLIDFVLLENQIVILSIILIFNIWNKTYLGDGGIYFLSFLTSIIIIKFVSDNFLISPYFAVSVFWYPCFENLFSIFRKSINRIKVSKADNYHLHHLIYLYFKKKKIFISNNNLTGLIILSFNLVVFFLSFKFYRHTDYLVILILSSVATYCICYFTLLKKLKISSN